MARIVFDLDGTLVDSAPDLDGIANALLALRGLQPVTLDQARSFIGQGVAVFVARLRAARGLPEAEQASLLAAFMARYDQAVTLTLPYPGVVEALTTLRAQGHALGLCTNKPMQPTLAVLGHLNLARHLTRIIAGDSLPVHKPDPAPLHAAFDLPGPGPNLYVGDSEVDAETAWRAEILLLIFTQGYRAAFDAFAELPALVRRQIEA